MIVPASRVKQFIDPKSSQPIELRASNGSLVGKIYTAEALRLIADDSVVGKCSQSRLKYLKLVSEERPAVQREHSPREFLARMVSARKFTYREHLMGTCSITNQPEWSGLTVWAHKHP